MPDPRPPQAPDGPPPMSEMLDLLRLVLPAPRLGAPWMRLLTEGGAA